MNVDLLITRNNRNLYLASLSEEEIKIRGNDSPEALEELANGVDVSLWLSDEGHILINNPGIELGLDDTRTNNISLNSHQGMRLMPNYSLTLPSYAGSNYIASFEARPSIADRFLRTTGMGIRPRIAVATLFAFFASGGCGNIPEEQARDYQHVEQTIKSYN